MVCSSFTNRKGFAIACDKTFKHFNCVYKNTVTAMLNTFWFMVIETFETENYTSHKTGVNWTQMCCKYRSPDDHT